MEKALMHIARFLHDQPVLFVAAVAACASMALCPPSLAYLDYLDMRVLGLLFSLMLCVAGLQQAGVFAWTAKTLLKGSLSVRNATLILMLLCFFASMLVTNDVALITFVPFTLFLFTVGKRQSDIAWAVVLQTLAANLGSMVTPMGNPQNLFLFAHYNLGLAEFFQVIAPFAGLSLAMLIFCACIFSQSHPLTPSHHISVNQSEDAPTAKVDPGSTLLFSVLFVAAVLAVVRIAPLAVTLGATVIATLVFQRKTLLKVDYALLCTFVCFFVFSGNLAHVDAIRQALETLMAQGPFAVSAIASQFISNVPAAVLLAPFTQNWQALLLGVDLGGLGTPVASLASLISLEFYRRAKAGSLKKFMGLFLLSNVAFLAVNILFGLILGAF